MNANVPITIDSIGGGALYDRLNDKLSEAASALVRARYAAERYGQSAKGLKAVVTLKVTLQREESVSTFKGVVDVKLPACPASVGVAYEETHPDTGELTLLVAEGGGDARQARLVDADGPLDAPPRRKPRAAKPEPEPEEAERTLGSAPDRKSRSAGSAA